MYDMYVTCDSTCNLLDNLTFVLSSNELCSCSFMLSPSSFDFTQSTVFCVSTVRHIDETGPINENYVGIESNGLRLFFSNRSFTSSRGRTRKVDDVDGVLAREYSRGSFLSRSSVFLINNYRRCPRSGSSLLSILRYIRPNRFEYYVEIESRAKVETLDCPPLMDVLDTPQCILMRKLFEAPRIKIVIKIGRDINT